MKRTVAMFVGALVSAASPVFAQSPGWTVEFGGGVAAPTSDISSRLSTGWGIDVGLGLIVGTSVVSPPAPSSARAQTVTGKLVDAACYKMDKSNIGVDHRMAQGSEKNCAVECARTGFPVALLTSDGKLYIVTGALAANKNAALISHMGHAVTLTGDVTEGVGAMTIGATRLSVGK